LAALRQGPRLICAAEFDGGGGHERNGSSAAEYPGVESLAQAGQRTRSSRHGSARTRGSCRRVGDVEVRTRYGRARVRVWPQSVVIGGWGSSGPGARRHPEGTTMFHTRGRSTGEVAVGPEYHAADDKRETPGTEGPLGSAIVAARAGGSRKWPGRASSPRARSDPAERSGPGRGHRSFPLRG